MAGGRPRKFRMSDDQKEIYLSYIREGQMRGAAADQMSLNRRLVRELILSDPKFEAAVLDAEVDATEHVQEALYQAAVSGNVAAAKAWIDLRTTRRPAASKPASGNVSPADEEEKPPAVPTTPDPQDADPLGFADNVTILDPRQRRKAIHDS